MRTREGGRIVDEAAVIARVRAGEPEAYAVLVRTHTGLALRAAKALGAGADAEDVVQQAFVKAYCALGRFRDGMAFKPWLLAIVANETRNTVRRAARQRTLADREAALVKAEPLIPESADPAVATLEAERRTALLAALEKLSEEHRLVVTYRYLLEMDEQETAQALGWPRGTGSGCSVRGGALASSRHRPIWPRRGDSPSPGWCMTSHRGAWTRSSPRAGAGIRGYTRR
ncbi:MULTISPECIES: RNA polymerase sigma factor [unclassified Streptomyces]|uniref:RNA polymerase sigma factor n=1 Tax=unclassified Streptomyces TaxID=2593676 RepID=UPI001F1CAABA|nr:MULTISPECIES: sigma-70 family RNA polymerase sigma factor [unclassified Streptomyces]